MSVALPEYPRPPLAGERDSGLSLGARVAMLVLTLFGEKFALNFCVNTPSADTAAGVAAVVPPGAAHRLPLRRPFHAGTDRLGAAVHGLRAGRPVRLIT